MSSRVETCDTNYLSIDMSLGSRVRWVWPTERERAHSLFCQASKLLQGFVPLRGRAHSLFCQASSSPRGEGLTLYSVKLVAHLVKVRGSILPREGKGSLFILSS